MVIAILEPVFAGIMVSLINKYLINGPWGVWLQQSCAAEEEVREDEADEVAQYSSTNTTISDADVHVHCH